MGAMNAEDMKNYKGVFVFAQQVDNKLSGISFELIGEGKRLADKLDEKVTAVLIGSDVKGLVDELAEYGADRVIVVDDPELKNTELSHMHMHLLQLSMSTSQRSF